jgi:putative phage-type endonuclease
MELTQEQHEARAERLGGSDCAAALGLSRWKTSLQLYLEKRGELATDRGESDEQWFGKAIEPIVRQWYAERTKRTVRLPVGSLIHPVHQWMVAHLDGYSVGSGDTRGYEGKSAVSSVGWGLENTDQIPVDAFMQCQHYMVVTGLTVFDVVCLVGRRFKPYEVRADEELHELIISGEREFMDRVKSGNPPPLDYHHRTALGLVRRIYPGTNGEIIKADEQAVKWRIAMEAAADVERAAKREKDAARAALLHLMGEAALLEFSDGRSFRRMEVNKAAYRVEAQTYIDARMVRSPREMQLRQGAA